MTDSVTFKRDSYPMCAGLWMVSFWGTNFVLLLKRAVPSPLPFLNIILVMTALLFFFGLAAYFFGKSKIVSVSKDGLCLYTGNPLTESKIFIEWNEIQRAEIAVRGASLLPYLDPLKPFRRIYHDTLVLHLKSPLEAVKAKAFEKENSSFLSPEQTKLNKDKNEVWITHPPRDGFKPVLMELSKHIEIQGSIDNTQEASIARFFGLTAKLILAVGFLLFLYLIIG